MFQLMLICLMLSDIKIVHGGTEAELRTLLDAKLNSAEYSPRVRPIKDTGNILALMVDLYLVGINGVDEVEQKITSTAYMKIVWTDSFMTWTPADYGNITEFTLPQEDIWKPDLALANAFDTITGLGDSFMYLTITHDGNITWEPFQVFESSCELDMTYFPFDKQTCEIRLVTWSSTSDMINIVTGVDGFSTEAYEENANWFLLGVSTYNSSTVSTSGLSFSMSLRRKPVYYLLNFMIPIVLLSVLNNFVFVLPCDSGEKSGYAMVLFLSFAIFLLIVTEIMPEGMNTIPVISSYLLVECVFSTVIVLLTIVQLRLHNQGEDTPVPNLVVVLTKFIQNVKRTICCEPGNADAGDAESQVGDDVVKVPIENKMNDKAYRNGNALFEKPITEKPQKRRDSELSVQVKRKLCCGASKISSDENEMVEVVDKSGSSEVGTELSRSSAKTDSRLGDILGKGNRVAPEAFFSKPNSVDPIYDQVLAVEDVDDMDEILTRASPKMANVRMGLRQTIHSRPLKTPEPKVSADDLASVKDEDADEVTWPEAVLALDNLFFVLFLTIKTLATIIAFTVSALN